ncbi:MAG: alpha/beta hydrolase [Marmoricola sp.]|nr:alpha/beta hydrolase [Marmoricola sp.]
MPDIRFAIEASLIKLVMGLPPRVQRVLVRRPVVLEGQQLALEFQLMLGLQRLSRIPGVETLPLAKARPALVRQAQLVGGKQPIAALRDVEVDGAEGPLKARLYTPTERVGAVPAPTLLFIHGGGWMYGDLESHDAECRFLAEASGVQVLAIDYRLSPEHPFPAAVEDCRAAYRWLVEHADEVNADPARLAVGGDSAGGAMAAATAVYAAEQGLPLAFQLLVYPGTDFVDRTPSRKAFAEGFFLTELFMTGAEEAYFAPGADKGHPDASALRRVDFPENLAPAFLATAGFDPLRDEGEAYAKLLAEKGVPVELVRYPAMIHGFMNSVGVGREAPANVREIAGKLRAALA